MKIFNFDPADYRQQYQDDGYVHIKNGVDPDFFDYLRRFTEQSFGEHRVEGRAIGGDKTQALFEFPAQANYPDELFDTVSSLCGLNRDGMTLSERHIKFYNADAEPEPLAHKDRFSSQVSMGVSVGVPKESRLVVYPRDHRDDNPFNVSGQLLASLPPEEHPSGALKDTYEVELDDDPGDVVLFPGRSVWHLRRNPASVTNLYLKMNDFNSDPLGEDPFTPARRSQTLDVIANGYDERADALVPLASRRLDTIVRQYTREWDELVQANVWDENPLTLTDADVRIIEAVDGRKSLAALAGEVSGNGLAENEVRQSVRRLAERGVIDLVG